MNKIIVIILMCLSACMPKQPTKIIQPSHMKGIPDKWWNICIEMVDQELPDVVDGMNLTPEQIICARALSLNNCGNMFQVLITRAEASGKEVDRTLWCNADWQASARDELMRRQCGEALMDPLPGQVAGEVLDQMISRVNAYAKGSLQ
jgi:hypothetical protein